jgi:geranylgeranyl pyrophosphate synthase
VKSDELAARLAEEGARIEPVLEELVPRRAGDYVSEAVWYHMEGGGKRVRPAICLLTCEKLGGDPARALSFATAVEVLHNMLLVHDDVEDGDRVRRDRPTVWVRYGTGNAINVGDFMLAAAYRAVIASPVEDATRVRLVATFTAALESTCRGQALDMNWRGRPDMTVADYMELVTLKTGRYMALGMAGGAIIAGMGDEVVRQIDALGECMGAAFQIRDDVIDLTAGKGRGGAIGNDIREGKSSILYAYALSAASETQRAEIVRVMAKAREETTDADVERVYGLYRELGAFDFARREADRLVDSAFQAVDRIPVRDKDFFRSLTRYMVSRST